MHCSSHIYSAIHPPLVSSPVTLARVDPLESSGISSTGSSEREQRSGRGKGRGRGRANTPRKERDVKPGLQSEGIY